MKDKSSLIYLPIINKSGSVLFTELETDPEGRVITE